MSRARARHMLLAFTRGKCPATRGMLHAASRARRAVYVNAKSSAKMVKRHAHATLLCAMRVVHIGGNREAFAACGRLSRGSSVEGVAVLLPQRYARQFCRACALRRATALEGRTAQVLRNSA